MDKYMDGGTVFHKHNFNFLYYLVDKGRIQIKNLSIGIITFRWRAYNCQTLNAGSVAL